MLKLTVLAIVTLLSTAFGFVIDPKVAISDNSRIVGGSDAAEDQFPYQVSIRIALNDKQDCGGSIVNSKWILTAAHCVLNSSPSDWYIFVGNVSLSGNGVTRQLSRMILHPEYNDFSVNNDIALLELEEELQFSSSIQPIELETEDVGVVDCVFSGWGIVGPNGAIPDIMQYINLQTLTTEQCLGYWGSNFAADREVCTPTSGGRGVCPADSGGPLAANDKQIGVVAWSGYPCGNGYPDVYTKVSAYIGWIEGIIG